jgi:hypothetical protein
LRPLGVVTLRFLALSLLLAVSGPQSAGRTVAIGDVHGDLDRFVAVLRHAGLVDGESVWSGGETQLVLTGDLLDRGADARGLLDLVMGLESQAAGRVHALLGNHEVLNLVGDLRYVAPEEYRAYADAASEDLRKSRYKSWLEFERARARRLGFDEPPTGGAERAAWMAAHPAGFFERRQAFGPDGTYGRWLRGLDAAWLDAGVLFEHGGPSPRRPFPSVEALNERVRRELARFDDLSSSLTKAGVLWPDLTWGEALALVREELNLWEAVDSLSAEQVDPAALEQRPSDETLGRMRELLGWASWTVMDSDGPLWYRGLATLPDDSLGASLDAVLGVYGAEHVVGGHTPTPDFRVRERAGGRVFLIDTGLSAAVGGRPSALEIQDGRFTVLYPGEASVPLWPAEPAAAAMDRGRPTGGAAGSARFTAGGARFAATVADDGASALATARADTPPGAIPAAADSETAAYDAYHGLTAAQIETFLREARVVEVRKIGAGVTKPSRATLDDGRIRHDAAIQAVDACEEVHGPERMRSEIECDSYKYNVAAYEIGKLLGLTSIPPTVERKFDGRRSAFTWWIDHAMTLADMKARALRQPDMADWNRQQWPVGIFDELIYNTDRNQGNLLVDPAWRVWMIDHTRAFHVRKVLRNAAMLVKMQMDPALLERLRGLSAADLEHCCGAYLTDDERTSLLARRDSIVSRFRGSREEP